MAFIKEHYPYHISSAAFSLSKALLDTGLTAGDFQGMLEQHHWDNHDESDRKSFSGTKNKEIPGCCLKAVGAKFGGETIDLPQHFSFYYKKLTGLFGSRVVARTNRYCFPIVNDTYYHHSNLKPSGPLRILDVVAFDYDPSRIEYPLDMYKNFGKKDWDLFVLMKEKREVARHIIVDTIFEPYDSQNLGSPIHRFKRLVKPYGLRIYTDNAGKTYKLDVE